MPERQPPPAQEGGLVIMSHRRPQYGDSWFFIVFIAIVLMLFLAKFARGDELVPASMPASAPAATSEEVIPLLEGAPAPFSGLLVPEKTFIGYMRQEIRITELTMKLDLRDRLLAEKPVVTKTPPTFGVGWSFVVGMGVGVVVAGVIVYGAVAVLKAMP